MNLKTKMTDLLLVNERSKNCSNIFAIYQFSLANAAMCQHKQPNVVILPEVHMFAAKKPCQIRYRWKAYNELYLLVRSPKS